jgi:hypothetical protein
LFGPSGSSRLPNEALVLYSQPKTRIYFREESAEFLWLANLRPFLKFPAKLSELP